MSLPLTSSMNRRFSSKQPSGTPTPISLAEIRKPSTLSDDHGCSKARLSSGSDSEVPEPLPHTSCAPDFPFIHTRFQNAVAPHSGNMRQHPSCPTHPARKDRYAPVLHERIAVHGLPCQKSQQNGVNKTDQFSPKQESSTSMWGILGKTPFPA